MEACVLSTPGKPQNFLLGDAQHLSEAKDIHFTQYPCNYSDATPLRASHIPSMKARTPIWVALDVKWSVKNDLLQRHETHRNPDGGQDVNGWLLTWGSCNLLPFVYLKKDAMIRGSDHTLVGRVLLLLVDVWRHDEFAS
jgi:hypothetical protein